MYAVPIYLNCIDIHDLQGLDCCATLSHSDIYSVVLWQSMLCVFFLIFKYSPL